jgi:hypothetical protein
MMRGLLVASVVGAAAFPAAAAADITPAGPAKLTVGYGPNIACPAYSGGAGVIVAWEINVGEGGQGGTVRPVFGDVVGDPVQLPAQPGRYRFPAPHLYRDMNTCGERVGLVQSTGNHAVLERDAPSYQYVNVAREGQPDERIEGARLAADMVLERDSDRDLRGDWTEDRTDLRLSANAVREADERVRVEVTVTNAGSLAADMPRLETTSLPGARWEGNCTSIFAYPLCVTSKLEPGESRLFRLRGDLPDAVAGEVAAFSEGPDLAGTDNRAAVILPAAPAFDLVAAPSQRLKNGILVQLRGIRAGRARVTAALKMRGKTVKLSKLVPLTPYTPKTVTIRATGAKLRSLRRMLSGGAISAELTARTISGKSPVTTKVKITR